jgi:two-component system, sensor histidine kinase and response regulator
MKNILIIEKDEESVTKIVSALNETDYFINVANSLTKGYQISKVNFPDLLICNKEIYDDNSDILDTLRSDNSLYSIPFIFLLDPENRKAKRVKDEYGLDFYLKIPFQSEDIKKIVKVAFDKYESISKSSEKKLNQLRGSISFSLPHEFFTPLNGILGFSEILLKDYDHLTKSEILEMLKFINKDAVRLKSITENFLAFAQLEITSKDPEKIKSLRTSYFVNLTEAVSSSAHEIAKKYERENDLVLELEESFIRMAEGYIKKAVEEVIDNSFKFSNEGTPVIIQIFINDRNVMISVNDNGRGMLPEQIASVGAYMQFNRPLHEQQGSGLGLIIAKKIVELHGGEFNIESRQDEGTKINLIFENS